MGARHGDRPRPPVVPLPADELLSAPALPFAAGPRRVLDGFGRAVASVSYVETPRSVDELALLLARARAEGLPVALRGAGRSYGDASMNGGGVAIDTSALRRVLAFDEAAGVLDCEPGVTIEDLWRAGLPRGFWPAVVPGTMAPTVAGSVAMNVHGKNHFRVGGFGDHVLELDLLTPAGERLTLSPDREPDLFRAVVGGFGVLGVLTRVRLRMKRVESGLLRVEGVPCPSLDALFDAFESRLPDADYLVAWVDAFPRGRGLGRGVLHRAWYLPAADDPHRGASLSPDFQRLPERLLGVVPRRHVFRLLRPLVNDPGMRALNAAKYLASRLVDRPGRTFLQSHVAFAFLLDYVPRWREAYGRGGFVQVQPFVPAAKGREVFRRVLATCRDRGLFPYLGVMKRHRPDGFLLSHALDGWSLALDLRVTPENRDRVWRLGQDLTDLVVDAGGAVYFAKDAVARPDQVRRVFGEERIARFLDAKRRLDPEGVLSTELSRRVLPELPVLAPR